MSVDSVAEAATIATIEAFGNVDVYLTETETIRGIFRRPGQVAKIGQSVRLDTSQMTLVVLSREMGNVERLVSVRLKEDKGNFFQLQVVDNDDDPSGRLKLFLSHEPEEVNFDGFAYP